MAPCTRSISHVAVPPGTALHRGVDGTLSGSTGDSSRRSSGDGPSSRRETRRRVRRVQVPGRRSSGDGPSSRRDRHLGPAVRERRRRSSGDGPSSRRGTVLPVRLRGRVAVPPGTALHRGIIGSPVTRTPLARSPFLRGRPFIEASPGIRRGLTRIRVAVPPGTALHRGQPDRSRPRRISSAVAVPPGTALHRGVQEFAAIGSAA